MIKAISTAMAALMIFFCFSPALSPGQAKAAEGTVSVGWHDETTEGGWTQGTNYMEINGKFALCCEHFKQTPGGGAEAWRVDTNVQNDLMRKVSYYGWGGPADTRQLSLIQTSCAISNARGTDITDVGRNALAKVSGLPSPPSYFVLTEWSTGGVTQNLITWEYNPDGWVEVYKTSSNPATTNGNACYSLEGAVFNVKSTDGTVVATLTTDLNGYAKSGALRVGNYTVEEVAAPKGYIKDAGAQAVTVNGQQTSTLHFQNTPLDDPMTILLQKKDAETDSDQSQGASSLQGAQYSVYYYDYYDSFDNAASTGSIPSGYTRHWVFETNEKGKIIFADKYKVGGDALYLDRWGAPTIPLGTIIVKETKAPEGYLLPSQETPSKSDVVSVQQIKQDADLEQVVGYNEATTSEKAKEQVKRSDLEFVKYKEVPESDPDANGNPTNDPTSGDGIPLSGIVFEIKSKTTGESVYMITNDAGFSSSKENGVYTEVTKDGSGKVTGVDETSKVAENPNGAFAFDTYTITELNTPVGLNPIPVKTWVASEANKIYQYQFFDDKIDAALTISKVDADSGKLITVSQNGAAKAHATFQIFTEPATVANRTPISMHVAYPSNQTINEFTTGDDGKVTLPEYLPYGTYYIHELTAPEGYMVNEEDFVLVVDQNTGFDNPSTITVPNKEQLGKLTVGKTDAEHKGYLPGVTFEVRASTDIVKGDGTVVYQKDALVDTVVTGLDGTATTKDLPLGTYYFKEPDTNNAISLDRNLDSTGIITNARTTMSIKTGGETVTGKKVEVAVADLEKAGYSAEVGKENSVFTLAPTQKTERSNDGKTLTLYYASGDYAKLPAAVTSIAVSTDWATTSKEYSNTRTVVPVLEGVGADGDTLKLEEGQTVSTGDTLAYSYEYEVEGLLSELLPSEFSVGSVKCTYGDGHLTAFTVDENGKVDKTESFSVTFNDALQIATITNEDNSGEKFEIGYEISVKDGERNLEFSVTKALAEKFNVKIEDTETVKAKGGFGANDSKWTFSFDNTLGNKVSPSAGATATVTHPDGTAEEVAMAGGSVTVEDLSIGDKVRVDYQLTAGDLGKEKSILNPYTYNDYNYVVNTTKYEGTIKYAGQTATAATSDPVAAENKSIDSLFTKADITTGKSVADAYLLVLDANGNAVDAWKTVGDDKSVPEHKIKGLAPGTYYMQETLAPTQDGYVKSSQIKFEVKNDGTVAKTEMKDDYTKVQISKQDITDAKEIVGAELTVFDTQGTEKGKWISDGKPHQIDYLPTGEYTLVEISAPDGYAIAENVQFTVDETGTIQPVVMYDAPKDDGLKDVDNSKVKTTSVSDTVAMAKTNDFADPLLLLVIASIAGAGAVVYTRVRNRRR